MLEGQISQRPFERASLGEEPPAREGEGEEGRKRRSAAPSFPPFTEAGGSWARFSPPGVRGRPASSDRAAGRGGRRRRRLLGARGCARAEAREEKAARSGARGGGVRRLGRGVVLRRAGGSSSAC